MDSPIHVLFVIDASGSMLQKKPDVIGGFNDYVAKLCEEGNADYHLSVVTFNTDVSTLFVEKKLFSVPELSEQTYLVGGNTALYDAIGTSLDELTAAIKTADHPYGTDRVVVIIMTDGEENSSRRFTKQQVVDAVAAREASGNWTFVYLGADQDAWGIGQGLGLAAGNVQSFSGGAVSRAFQDIAVSTQVFAASAMPSSTSFTTPPQSSDQHQGQS